MSKCTYKETGCGDCELTIKADKYRWRDLRKNPQDLPSGDWVTPLDIIFTRFHNQYKCYTVSTYVRGEFMQCLKEKCPAFYKERGYTFYKEHCKRLE